MQTLDEWLQHWLTQHPREIVMGLTRVRQVWAALGAPRFAATVFTVAGTNGKGSTVAFLDAILRSAGYRVGRYTSPHLYRYNERVVVDGVEVGDAALIAAFERIEAARADVALTYFEAGTLAAMLIFSESGLDAAVLEVGLGGRLDAVNLVDADVAVITSIGLDHQDLLGDTLDAIAIEKAGICRAGQPVVLAMPRPPDGLLRRVAELDARPLRAMLDYSWQRERDHWTLRCNDRSLTLPLPQLSAPIQLRNAAAAVVALTGTGKGLAIGDQAIREGISAARVPGRLQVVAGPPLVVFDVAHNPEAAQSLADWLDEDPRPTRAVFSALADKDTVAIVRLLKDRIAHWHLCGLAAQSPRGLDVATLAERIQSAEPSLSLTRHATPEQALDQARAVCAENERVLVFGSFYLIAALMPR